MEPLRDDELMLAGTCMHDRLVAVKNAIEGVVFSGAAATALSNAIDTATAPLVLTAEQKRRAVLRWAEWKIGSG